MAFRIVGCLCNKLNVFVPVCVSCLSVVCLLVCIMYACVHVTRTKMSHLTVEPSRGFKLSCLRLLNSASLSSFGNLVNGA